MVRLVWMVHKGEASVCALDFSRVARARESKHCIEVAGGEEALALIEQRHFRVVVKNDSHTSNGKRTIPAEFIRHALGSQRRASKTLNQCYTRSNWTRPPYLTRTPSA